jgi:tRNA A-37 threonylcarbamoyl transferase component Bud32
MNYIIDPFTNKTYSIFSNDGMNLLKKYVAYYQKGGSGKATKTKATKAKATKATKASGSESGSGSKAKTKATKGSGSGATKTKASGSGSGATKTKAKASGSGSGATKAKSSGSGRQPLCVLRDYEYIGRLGETGLEGEVWKVRHKETDKIYACKIFELNIPKYKILIEAECIRKMGELNVSPKLIKVMDHCIIMEMVNGVVLAEYIKQNNTYDEAIIHNLLEIANALIESNIKYNDLNVRYNMMFDKDKNKLVLIDFGLLLTDEKQNEYKQKGLNDKEITTIYAFNTILEVELYYMIKIYGRKDYLHTPLMLGFIPPEHLSHFPTILNYIDKDLLYLLDYTIKFGQIKKILDNKIATYKKIFNYEKEYKKLETLMQKYGNVEED